MDRLQRVRRVQMAHYLDALRRTVTPMPSSVAPPAFLPPGAALPSDNKMRHMSPMDVLLITPLPLAPNNPPLSTDQSRLPAAWMLRHLAVLAWQGRARIERRKLKLRQSVVRTCCRCGIARAEIAVGGEAG